MRTCLIVYPKKKQSLGAGDMKLEHANALDIGIYKLYWKSGGYSIATVGMASDGRRWMAPVNWCGAPLDSDIHWLDVESVDLVVTVATIADSTPRMLRDSETMTRPDIDRKIEISTRKIMNDIHECVPSPDACTLDDVLPVLVESILKELTDREIYR
jgi:hypothetical protein